MPTLKELYEDPKSPAAFSNPQALYRVAKKYGYTLKETKDFLAKNPTYTTHVQKTGRVKRAAVIAYFQDFAWQADLAEIKHVYQNRRYKFLLIVVDCFDYHLWVKPLKNKRSETVAEAFSEILSESGRTPATLYTDLGTEFTGSPFARVCSKNGVHQVFLSNTKLKAQIAELHVKILMRKVAKFTSHRRSKNFVDYLDDIVTGLNNRYIESLGRSPNQVNAGNAVEVFERKYSKDILAVPKKAFKKGDTVRIRLKFDSPFRKKYLQTYSTEIFRVKRIESKPPVLTYVLEDDDGYEVEGLYYAEDLVLAHHND